MSYITNHKQQFEDLKFQIENQDQLRRQANGGNSILFSYLPNEERLYIEKARELYPDNVAFIDVSQLFVKFIDVEGWDSFREYYQQMDLSAHKVFHDEDAQEHDLFDQIISEIEFACQNNKIPFLIRTGCLYGTGIENVNIMEHRAVMNLPHPLVIFYPSRFEDDNLYFMNFKLASTYRCTLVK
ncbi:hypothetical protein GO003_007305 [Methylicorpusculum oleiharenae]|uniref:hypothetical protein n=1 Tax=Methylicorpusculum oleiharenae TaxID=1338687 RepID=UPI00135C307F|nr:hypothetical protein [Methylicorpusculum oleiharenae]MCD2450191.1 hypothetical protein [Methylicorpusculum oleiharenae]